MLLTALTFAAAITTTAPVDHSVRFPVSYYTLPNGLRVVLSRDTTAPTVVVAVYYHIGFRLEPRNRTGFAHLFEHFMFQGSTNLGKMEFIRLVESNGGTLNGSTRFDFTNYFEVVPANTLETMLWAEADRMRGLALSKEMLANQQEVVKSEVRVNVLNRPYGGFPWLTLPEHANTNWYNAHNFYGDLHDIDAATLDDARTFFRTYYAPGNAALVIVGDFDPKQARSWIEQYFGPIQSSPRPPRPDLTEPRQQHEIRGSVDDTLATRPALAFAYHMPPRNSPEYYAMGLIDQILLQGNDSRLHQALVQQSSLTGDVSGGINLLGNMFDYEGPMLWMGSLYHDQSHSTDEIMRVIDATIDSLRKFPVDRTTLQRAMTKERAARYRTLSQLGGFGKADLLASEALFDNDPTAINRLDERFEAVTPDLVQRTVQEYLAPTNRTVVSLVAKGKNIDAPSTGQ